MIYTLDWIEKEAELISGYWNGSDERFVDGNGDARTEDDVDLAQDLQAKIKEVRELMGDLGI